MSVSVSQVLDGKKIAAKYLEIYSKEIQTLKDKGHALSLATVRVGESKDAILYSKAIFNLMNRLGVDCPQKVYPDNITQDELYKELKTLNNDPNITGILVFSPLPRHLHPVLVLNAVDVFKDVEGRRVLDTTGERIISPTAAACLTLIDEAHQDVAGHEAVIVGRSEIVGKPCAILLMDKQATVTVCHSKTKDLKAHVEKADIVVATAGRANLIKGEWIKKGATVIDVGENVVDGKLVGDVEYEAARERAGFISPVPGGVGPVTNVMLVKNLILLHKLRQSFHPNSQ